MAEMRSKMRTVELTTVSAMRSTRRELEKAAAETARASGRDDGGELVEVRRGSWAISAMTRGDGPGLGDAVGLEPARKMLFAVAEVERACRAGWRGWCRRPSFRGCVRTQSW